MAIFVQINAACERDAKRHGRLADVERLASEIERKQSIDNLEKHLPSPIVEKVFGRSFSHL
jgi:hypothetical protein